MLQSAELNNTQWLPLFYLLRKLQKGDDSSQKTDMPKISFDRGDRQFICPIVLSAIGSTI